MNIYLRKQKELKKQANRILKDLSIVSRLEKIGKTDVVGSYAMNLMASEDIDI